MQSSLKETKQHVIVNVLPKKKINGVCKISIVKSDGKRKILRGSIITPSLHRKSVIMPFKSRKEATKFISSLSPDTRRTYKPKIVCV